MPIGRTDRGTTRLAWTDEDDAAADWFRAQAESLGLKPERDPAGNLWALPDSPPPWWALGSHLDTVREGGAYDGALGVAAAFEVAAATEAPVAVISFADEEGARFNTPTFGSRALAGVLDPAVLERADENGVTLAEASGLDAAALARASDSMSRLRGFVELHIDQTTDLARAGRPAGIVRALAARVRVRVELSGRADHAGTTPSEERRDALAAAARLIVAAQDEHVRATAARILVEPNALTTVPAHATLWLDARAPAPEAVDAWRARLAETAAQLERETGVAIALTLESENRGSTFDPGLRERLHRLDPDAPELDCYAGHDAGVLAARIAAAMVFVRNPSGVSHSPEESVDLDDAAVATDLLRRLVEDLHR